MGTYHQFAGLFYKLMAEGRDKELVRRNTMRYKRPGEKIKIVKAKDGHYQGWLGGLGRSRGKDPWDK